MPRLPHPCNRAPASLLHPTPHPIRRPPFTVFQMEKCYIINAPWVFYALWKGLTPLVSANTAKKVQVSAGVGWVAARRDTG